jgi:hypothetical protein
VPNGFCRASTANAPFQCAIQVKTTSLRMKDNSIWQQTSITEDGVDRSLDVLRFAFVPTVGATFFRIPNFTIAGTEGSLSFRLESNATEKDFVTLFNTNVNAALINQLQGQGSWFHLQGCQVAPTPAPSPTTPRPPTPLPDAAPDALDAGADAVDHQIADAQHAEPDAEPDAQHAEPDAQSDAVQSESDATTDAAANATTNAAHNGATDTDARAPDHSRADHDIDHDVDHNVDHVVDYDGFRRHNGVDHDCRR